MEKVAKVEKKVVSDVEALEPVEFTFKSRFEMKAEDVALLQSYPVKLVRLKSKKSGNLYYQARLLLSPNKVLSSPIEAKIFNIALMELKQDLSSDELLIKKCGVRFSKGIGKTGHIYYQYEMFISESIKLAFFFDRLDLREIELMVEQKQMQALDILERGIIDELDTDEINVDF